MTETRKSVWANHLDLKPYRRQLLLWLASNFFVRRGCWVYSGLQNREYPIKCWRIKGVAHIAAVHVLSFRLWKLRCADIPAGHEVHHICGNTWCYNPGHLELLTVEEHKEMHRQERFNARLWRQLNESVARLKEDFGDEPSVVSHYRSPTERRMSAVL